MKRDWTLAVIASSALLVGACDPKAPAGSAAPKPQLTGSPKTKDGAILKGHTESVLGLAFSPDGSNLAAGSYDGALSLWDLATGEGAWLEGHPKGVICVAFSPDGKLLASGGWDKSVKIWDVTSKKEVASFQDLPDVVTAVAFAPDSKLLAVGISDSFNDSKTMVKVFEISGKKEQGALHGNKLRINWLAFSQDGQMLASGSQNLLVWDVKEGKKKQAYDKSGTCQLGAFWPDGKVRAFTTPSSWSIDKPQTAGVITFLDPEKEEALAQFEGHSHRVAGLALSSDRRLLASASKEIKLWDLKEKKEVFSSAPSAAVATAVALSADGRMLAAGGDDGTIKLWDLSDVAPTQKKP